MKSGESHSVQLQAPDFIFWHGRVEAQGSAGYGDQLCSRCWCQSELPSGWKQLLKALGSGCLKLSGCCNPLHFPCSVPVLVLLSWLLKGHLVLGRAGLCQGLQPELEMAQQQGEFWH